MVSNPDKYHRRSIRLKDFDYSQSGAYFITICTHNKECVFGDVVNGKMWLNKYGRIILEEWIKTENIRANVRMDFYVVMPNHVHGLIVINHRRGVLQYAPTKTKFQSPSQTVGAIVRGFKSVTTKRINQIRYTPGLPVWQRNYYEHVIRNKVKLNKIREYIQNNSLKWHLDRENPERIGVDVLEEEIFKYVKVAEGWSLHSSLSNACHSESRQRRGEESTSRSNSTSA